MSKVQTLLDISIPEHLMPGNTSETFYNTPVDCTYCHGKGFFDREGTKDSCEKDSCSVCKGSGKIQAKIVIEWAEYRK